MLRRETMFVFHKFTGRHWREIEKNTTADCIEGGAVRVRSIIDGDGFEATIEPFGLELSLDEISRRFIRPMLSRFNWMENS